VAIGSGKGKTAGRGGKGQTARSGVRIKGFEGGRCRSIGACRSAVSTTSSSVEFAEIQSRPDPAGGRFQADRRQGNRERGIAGKSGVIRRAKAGVAAARRGELKAKLNIEVQPARSNSAIAAVEKAGGSVKILAPAKEDEGKAA